MITGAGAVINSLKVGVGKSIAVFGTGSVGLSAVMAAKLVGAGKIIAIDLRDDRLKLALEFGATHTINPRQRIHSECHQVDHRQRRRFYARDNRADANPAAGD